MPKQFCSCGAATEYTLSAPKFCQGCGASFSSLGATVAPVVVNNPPPRPRTQAAAATPKPQLQAWREDEGDDDDYEEAPRPTGRTFKIPKKLAVSFQVDTIDRRPLNTVMQGSEDSITTTKKNISKREQREIAEQNRVKLERFRNKLNTVERHEIGGGKGE